MKRVLAFSLAVILCVLCAACRSEPYSVCVMPAGTGRFSDIQLLETIERYDGSTGVHVTADAEDLLVFQVDYAIASATINYVCEVDPDDSRAELEGDILLFVETSVDGNRVTIDLSWWRNSKERSSLWSYVLCLVDMDGVAHYYYFRVDHKKL